MIDDEVIEAEPLSYRRVLLPETAAKVRSKVSNQREILPGVDGRSGTARRYKDLVAQICVDQGGLNRCSELKLQLIRRYASISVMSEELEAKLVRGENVSINDLTQLSSALVRLSQRIGIAKVPKKVNESLSDIMRPGRKEVGSEGA